MSREHFHESQIEDRVTQLMEEGMSDEDAIQKAESEYDGQVNLVEEQALRIHEKAYEMNKKDIERKLRQGCYPSEIILDKIVQHLQTKHENIHGAYAKNLLSKIDEWTMEVNNAE